MELPAGIMPEDQNIELFANPKKFGKCFFLQYGVTKPFNELHPLIIIGLYDECFSDKEAVKAMNEMGIHDNDKVEFYNHCNRGTLNSIPDITPSGKRTTEYYKCGRHGKCIGEGRVCKPLFINGSKITHRERECLSLLAEGKTDEQIRVEMGFKSQASVNSQMNRLRLKTGVNRRSEMAIIAKEVGL